MAWFKKTKKPIAAKTKEKASRVPEGLWVKCPDCSQAIYNNVNAALSGKVSPQDALKTADGQINKALATF